MKIATRKNEVMLTVDGITVSLKTDKGGVWIYMSEDEETKCMEIPEDVVCRFLLPLVKGLPIQVGEFEVDEGSQCPRCGAGLNAEGEPVTERFLSTTN